MAKKGPVTKTEIRGFRARMGWTQIEFAEYIGVNPRTVSRWENGVTRPQRSLRYHMNVLGIKKAAR